MYAMLMRKHLLSNDVVIYNPIKAIKGEIDKEYNYFIDEMECDFPKATDEYFITSSQYLEGYAYPITEEDLLNRYGTDSLEEALEKYQDEVFEAFNFSVIEGEKFVMHQINYEELKAFFEEPELSFDYYNGSVNIPKRKLYMLTQIEDKKDLRKFIDEILKKFNELDKSGIKKGSSKKDKDNNDEILKAKASVFSSDLESKNIRRDIDTDELEAYLKERIIGQDEKIEELVTVIADNYKTSDPHLIQRPLLIGPSGVGKTETLKLIAEYLDIPFTRYSTPTLSGAGYVGNNVDDILKLAYYNSSRKEKICNESLIFLDEFDKINLRGNDVSDKAVQNLLLNFLDGTVYDVEVNSGYRIQLDTTLMCIVLGGAFEDIFKKKKKKIGFGDSESELNKLTITDADIIEYGFIPEIVGRCDPKILYNNLTREDFKNILLKGKLSPIYLKQQFYKEVYDVDLKILDTYIEAVLDRVVDNNTGARELKQIVFSSLSDISHTLQSKKNRGKYSEVIVDKEILSDSKVYTLKKR